MHIYIYTSKKNIYIYIHIARLAPCLISFLQFLLPKILKNCCVTSGDEKLQNAKPREPRGSFYNDDGFSERCWILKLLGFWTGRTWWVSSTFQLGMPSLNPYRDGESRHPVTEPFEAPKLEGAGWVIWCFFLRKKSTIDLPGPKSRPHTGHSMCGYIIDSLPIRGCP